MNSSPCLENIAAALSLAQASVSAALKSGHNTFDRYHYATYESISAAAKPVMAEHGLSVIYTASELIPLEDRRTRNDGVEHAVRVKVDARLLHKSGEWMESSAWGEGQDRADKAPYKAMTGAKKYLLAGLLAIATADDPEADSDGRHEDRSESPQQRTQRAQADARAREAAARPKGQPAPSTASTPPGTSQPPAAGSPSPAPTAGSPAPESDMDKAKRLAREIQALTSESLAVGVFYGSDTWPERVAQLETVHRCVSNGVKALGERYWDILNECMGNAGFPRSNAIKRDQHNRPLREGFPSPVMIRSFINNLTGEPAEKVESHG